MKKAAIFVLALTLSCCARAQNMHHKAFKADLSGGFDPISSPPAFDFTIEPHYRFAESFALGLRFQVSASGDFKSEGSSNFRDYSSNCLSADYYFLTGNQVNAVQVFAGGGLGVFTESYKQEPDKDNFGFFPRAGIEARHFRASVEYNDTGALRNYFSFNFGIIIGGGVK